QGIPASGNFETRFEVYDAVTNGNRIAGPLVQTVSVSKNTFTVMLDFGSGVFTGEPRWLEVALRRITPNENYVILNPRHSIAQVPYAIHALTAASLTGPIDPSQLPDATTASKGLLQIGR